MNVRFKYYEDEGRVKTFTMKKIYRMFCVMIDEEQKKEGTTFLNWLSEMEKMQILLRC